MAMHDHYRVLKQSFGTEIIQQPKTPKNEIIRQSMGWKLMSDVFWLIMMVSGIVGELGSLPVTTAGRGVPANRALADPPV